MQCQHPLQACTRAPVKVLRARWRAQQVNAISAARLAVMPAQRGAKRLPRAGQSLIKASELQRMRDIVRRALGHGALRHTAHAR